jgi:hypothetical protein
MTSDSGLFETAPGPGLVPLYEAKMIHQYDHRWATYTGGDENSVRDVTEEEKRDPDFRVRPRYWVPQAEVETRLLAKGWERPWLMGWRNIGRATDERTIISSIIPRVAVGHSMPLIFASTGSSTPSADHAVLTALLNSLVVDYTMRQKLGGVNLTYSYMKQLAILSRHAIDPEIFSALVCRVLCVTGSAAELHPFSAECSREIADLDRGTAGRFSLSSDDASRARWVLLAEIDALVAHLYGLSRQELAFILDPAALLGEDYPTETFRVLRNGEIAAYGEYRTGRLVLDAWDRLVGPR